MLVKAKAHGGGEDHSGGPFDFSSFDDEILPHWELRDEIVSWEELINAMRLNEGFYDSADYLDQDVSEERVKFDEHRRQLKALIADMVHDAPSWDGEATKVDLASAQTAARFLDALPINRKLPLVSPDGEGDILFVWDQEGDCIVTVEPDTLHMVIDSGAPKAKHIDAVKFPKDSRQIPLQILHNVPMK